VEIPKGGAEGVLLSAGGVDGGYTFYVKDGKLQYDYNYVAEKLYHVESGVEVPEGRHKLRFEFEVTGKPEIRKGKGAPGRAQLYVEGSWWGSSTFPLRYRSAWGWRAAFPAGPTRVHPLAPATSLHSLSRARSMV
jgi:hypothetical protein